MSAVHDAVAALLRDHGLDLLIGTTVVLAGFTALIAASRSLASKHRLASTAIVAIAAYALLALVPMPRLARPIAPPATAPMTEQTPHPGADETAASFARPTEMPAAQPLSTSRKPQAAAPITASAPPMSRPLATTAVTGDAGDDLAATLSWLLLMGAAYFLAQLLLGWLRLRRILRSCEFAPRALRELVELPRRTRLRVTDTPVQPFCCGLFGGTIVLPRTLTADVRAARFVLLHEREHLRSGDARLRALTALLRPLLFWHPLFWWLQHQLRFTGELLADDAAGKGAVADYVRCMVALATQPAPSPTGTLVATVFHRRSELFRRLEMMLKRDPVLSHSPSVWQRGLRPLSAIALVAFAGGAFGVEPAHAQDPLKSQQLKAQIVELRATVHALQAELEALRLAEAASAQLGTGSGGGIAGGTATQQPADLQLYSVKKGDSIERIALELYESPRGVDRLRQLNRDMDPRRLGVGQHLVVDAVPQRAAAIRAVTSPQTQRPSTNANATRGSDDASLAGLAGLVTRCIELRGEVEIQEVEADFAQAGAEKGVVGKREAMIATIRLRTKKDQYAAIAGMLKTELDRAGTELDRARQLVKKGFVTKAEVRAAEQRVKLLGSALR